jgi:hypothetical protein
MDTIILTKNDWVECDGCGEKIAPVFWNRTFNKETKTYSDDETMEFDFEGREPDLIVEQISQGLTFELCGGYGEFFDCMSEDDVVKITACHECMVKMFSLFDRKTKHLRGLHPSDKDGDMCCEWGW